MKNIYLILLLSISIYGLESCNQSEPSDDAETTVSKEENEVDDTNSDTEKNTPKSSQVIVAYSNQQNSVVGKLYGMEFIDGNWQVTFDTIDCSFGKNGFADFDKKVEGDGKSPAGKFPIGAAFGYKADLTTNMDFIELKDNHYWISENDSELYNQLVDFEPPKDVYAEKMKRNDHLYKYGIIIEYNTQEVVPGKGSAIFIHLERKKGSPTSGCVASSEDNIKKLIQWVKPDKNPMITMGSLEQIKRTSEAPASE